MNTHTIYVIKDFHKRPYGRDEGDAPGYEGTGLKFRKNLLVPALNTYPKVHVVLDGYNRYGPSFLDEAFGGLVRDEDFSGEFIQKHLTYSHSELKSIEQIIDDRINAAIQEKSRTA